MNRETSSPKVKFLKRTSQMLSKRNLKKLRLLLPRLKPKVSPNMIKTMKRREAATSTKLTL
jgi:hypothetical protein